MCAQTRPRFILSSEGVFGGMEFEPMLTPRGKSPLPEKVPRVLMMMRRMLMRMMMMMIMIGLQRRYGPVFGRPIIFLFYCDDDVCDDDGDNDDDGDDDDDDFFL